MHLTLGAYCTVHIEFASHCINFEAESSKRETRANERLKQYLTRNANDQGTETSGAN